MKERTSTFVRRKEKPRRDPEIASDRQRPAFAIEQMARERGRPPRDLVEPAQDGVDFALGRRKHAALDGREHIALEHDAVAPARPHLGRDVVAQHVIPRPAATSPAIQRLKVGEGAGGERALSRDALVRAAQALAVRPVGRRVRERREQAEIDVHRLKRFRSGVDGLDMAAGDVAEQRAERCGRRRHAHRLAEPLGGGEASGHQADGGGFHIAFAAGDLAGEAQPRLALRAAASRRAASAN